MENIRKRRKAQQQVEDQEVADLMTLPIYGPPTTRNLAGPTASSSGIQTRAGAFVLSQFTCLTDGQTDRLTDGFIVASTRLHS